MQRIAAPHVPGPSASGEPRYRCCSRWLPGTLLQPATRALPQPRTLQIAAWCPPVWHGLSFLTPNGTWALKIFISGLAPSPAPCSRAAQVHGGYRPGRRRCEAAVTWGQDPAEIVVGHHKTDMAKASPSSAPRTRRRDAGNVAAVPRLPGARRTFIDPSPGGPRSFTEAS